MQVLLLVGLASLTNLIALFGFSIRQYEEMMSIDLKQEGL